MSELINGSADRKGFRWQLLTTVSALALLGSVYGGETKAADDDGDHPTVWIELGGQLEQVGGSEERFAPPFSAGIAQLGFASPMDAERPARFSNGGEGKISFEPNDSGWSFSAAIRYGRSQSQKHFHTQNPTLEYKFLLTPHYPKTDIAHAVNFADTLAENNEAHTVLDFQAGKDVGLGMFGLSGDSKVSVGVRIAQFTSHSRSKVNSDQNVAFARTVVFPTHKKYLGSQFTAFQGSFEARRSFSGVGPSISWDASAALSGSPQESGITFDWGANAAILFGRQKTFVHKTISTAIKSNYSLNTGQSHYPRAVTSTQHSGNPARSRFVTVPNIGGFAGLSFRYAAAKVSLGYRADFFFGAMDGGIDTAKRENIGFYGPFATISIGFP